MSTTIIIDDLLSTETKLAHLIGLPQFFDQSTAHRYLNRFGKWHVNQLDRVNTQVLAEYGESMRQDIILLDVDSQTHTLESRKREGAVGCCPCRLRINQSGLKM